VLHLVSENEEKPATGPVATDGSAPQLPTDGAPEAPADPAEVAEDRTTPANGSTGNGAVAAEPGHAEPEGAAVPDGGVAGSGVAPAGSGDSGPAVSGSGVAAAGAAGSAAAGAGAPASGTNGSDPAADETAVFAKGTPTPVPRPRPDAPAAAPESEQPTETYFPGSVPTPPPWRRASGSDVTETAVPTARPTPRQAPVESLLSEAPTAYIDPPRSASVGPAQGEVHAGVPAVGERAPRQALLQVKRFDPWSVLKLALVLAVVLFFIWLVAVGVLYGVLDGIGVWDRLNGTYADLVSGGGEGGGGSLISAGSVFGLAAVIGAINSLLFAVAMTVGAFVYNVSADLVGGVEVTLSERD
jgi:hypothetical protein